ncbi:phage portal protein [Sedimentimonas flavescens]|uniref:Phage portal protein n=1 Tax=Sedimentimonas flavescens TaxID=2851012 RepID=A0ABT2ZV28_9RHOB|nr:phage portal protein [Sedimentimonas flavescens]MCV2877600.1 phage portal protein [Sedimentimonas flavescens]
MKRLIKAAIRGVRQVLAAGESGWVSTEAAAALSGGGFSSVAGKTVSPESALTISTAWSCVRKTSQVVSTLPLKLYEKTSDDSRVAIDHDICEIVCSTPNSVQTNVEFWEGMIAHLTMRGNAVAERKFIGKSLVGLRPLPNLTPFLDADGHIAYEFYDRGKKLRLPADKVFHLRSFDPGSGIGLSAIKYGANSLGSALAADETAGSVFSNAMMLSGLLTSDQTLTPEQRATLQVLLEAYVSSKKAGKTLVLEAGLKFETIQMNPEDAQLLETRQFQVEDVCRWFGVPPIVVGHASQGQTMWGSGVEQIMLSWLTLGVNPLLTLVEARMNRDLIPIEKRGKWYFEFNREAMLQMDSKAKGEFMAKMGNSGTMTANERRAKLNLPRHPDPAADALLAQTALAPLEDLGKDKGK